MDHPEIGKEGSHLAVQFVHTSQVLNLRTCRSTTDALRVIRGWRAGLNPFVRALLAPHTIAGEQC